MPGNIHHESAVTKPRLICNGCTGNPICLGAGQYQLGDTLHGVQGASISSAADADYTSFDINPVGAAVFWLSCCFFKNN